MTAKSLRLLTPCSHHPLTAPLDDYGSMSFSVDVSLPADVDDLSWLDQYGTNDV